MLIRVHTWPLILLLLQPAFPVHSIQVEGNAGLPADAIVRASGLQVGQNATAADFQAASARLSETGLFENVSFRYKAAPGVQPPGFDVVFQVTELSPLHPVRLEVPGFDETQLWTALQQRDPLLRNQIPDNNRASGYYARAIEQFLATQGRQERIVARLEIDPSAGAVTIFRPEVLARVVEVHFEGTHAVPPEALDKVARGSLIGSEYAEQRFRELLEDNLRPLYEEQGRLRVSFPRIAIEKRAGGVAVTVSVEEGPVYTLGSIDIACQGVPTAELLQAGALVPGQVADWKKVSMAAANMQTALTRYGYLDSSSQVERTLDDRNGRVDVLVALQKGRQFTFGALTIKGLSADLAARARKLWKLPSGAPMNVPYVDEYLRAVALDPQIHRAVRTVGRRVQPRPESGVVDVTVTFE